MNAQMYLKKMVPPNKKRPKIMRGGILQIQVTRACDLGCFNCTQGSNLGGKPVMMTPDEFELACQSLKGYWGVVGMFGGNPAIHPKFNELCKIMRKYFPLEQRGIWCNHPHGNGKTMRKTFDPAHSNLNVHCSQEAWDEFERDWPESGPYLKGLSADSEHSPWALGMLDLKVLPFPDGTDRENTEENRWKLISKCDVNQFWSAIVCKVPNVGVRAFFCEIAGTMAMLHSNDPNWPDLGLEPVPGWWKKSMEDFEEQATHYCHRCSIPLRLKGQKALTGEVELVTITHADIYKPKDKYRLLEIVNEAENEHRSKATDYIQNGSLK